MNPARILIVDDDPDVLTAGRLLLKSAFADVVVTQRPEDIGRLMDAAPIDVILLDMNYVRGASSSEEGFRWLGYILDRDPEAVIIVITAHGGVQLAVEAMKRGATDFIAKPWGNERLMATVLSAAQLRRSRRETQVLKQRNDVLAASTAGPIQPLLGASSSMKQIMSVIARAAPTDANILIIGENGTGKELVAREIHRQSRRSGTVFMPIDVGSVTETLFESELFGHRKGAFTDAKSDRIGRFQAAEGGTLFLDEIGNLPLHLQPKLLTALEQRHITPVGANTAIPVDVRVICATNMAYDRLTDEKVFRQDLLYRLNTVEVHLPPLRDRPDDIPILVDHFLKIYAKRYGTPVKHLSKEALTALRGHHWPGNVRALRHAVERAVIMGEGEMLTPAAFSLTGAPVPPLAAPAPTESPGSESDALKLDVVEKRVVEQALRKHRWNISHAAAELGLTRTSLYRRMEKHGL